MHYTPCVIKDQISCIKHLPSLTKQHSTSICRYAFTFKTVT
uniref:Uncharacterized protein n=1 Tax=Anguilla anguilla TaxID=7936 RepID=A0A0E9RTY2_ANGAN